jgi:Tfp pilus assembly protein PilZ
VVDDRAPRDPVLAEPAAEQIGLTKEDERRKHPRIDHRARVLFRSESLFGEGHITSISDGGVFVQSEQIPRRGERVWILFHDPSPRLEVVGKVRWTSRENPGSAPGFGVEVEHIGSAYRQLVESLRDSG